MHLRCSVRIDRHRREIWMREYYNRRHKVRTMMIRKVYAVRAGTYSRRQAITDYHTEYRDKKEYPSFHL